ncbi:MAG: sigma-54-dependent Fis family transcriptional regulator [Sandaracinus sp.]
MTPTEDDPALRIATTLGVVDGSPSDDARCALWLGQIGRARELAEAAIAAAEVGVDEVARGFALAALAGVDAREGHLERAIARWDEASSVLGREGRHAGAATASLDAAEALLERDGPADVSAAASRLAAARTRITDHGLEALRPRLRVLLAAARGATGDVEGGLADLAALEPEQRSASARDIAWRIHAVSARLATLAGAETKARKAAERALEILEDVATSLPKQARDAFWSVPARTSTRGTTSGRTERSATSSDLALGGRWARLLEITKRLATERDLSRLLARINESAVDLSGAERGFVLLVGEDGKLEAHAVRDAAHPDDPHVAFSQSIAEAVLIDGEPIVTVDAQTDRRLSEYVSVHRLMLQSVACVPIRAASILEGEEPGASRGSAMLGVLYVEHRVRRARFGQSDLELLLAFADQAAIALANAKLYRDLDAQRRELAEANEALEKAKDDIERLLDARTAELDEARGELVRTRDALRLSYERHGIVGRSEGIRRVLGVIDRVAPLSVPVVIQGESGTGKELVARAIHFGGPRAKRPFVALNCAAVPETLLESELFGHKRGAFTGADRDRNGVFVQAHGGTLFLDEIGDMPAKMQVELLRVLADGRVKPVGGEEETVVDVRIVAASNKSLKEQVEKGLFREDLYYRLAVVEMRLPSLRERRADIPLLAEHFLTEQAKREGLTKKRITKDALAVLASHPLPGNVRQLEHVLMSASIMCAGDTIGAADLAVLTGGEPVSVAPEIEEIEEIAPARAPGEPPPANVEEWKAHERRKILEALEASGWNRVRAAGKLGMPRRTFYRRLREYGILE